MFKFKILKNIRDKKELINILKPGDLVWAKMPLSRKKLRKIDEGHKVRPYLVVDKNRFFIYAYQSSSKQSETLNNTQEYCINRFRYKQKKDSYINLTEVYKIPFYKIKNKHIALNDIDLKNIQKRLVVNSADYNLTENIYILEGDVIKHEEQLYYVYASDNVYVYCFYIFKKYPKDGKKYKEIIINNKTYYTTFKEKTYFSRKTNMTIKNIAYNVEIEEILQQKKGVKRESKSNTEKKKQEKNYKIFYESGTVLKVGNSKIVYLFKSKNKYYGVDLLMYRIRPRVIPIYNMHTRPIIEILSAEEYIKIIDFLYSKNVQPLKEINDLYDDLRTVMYG